MLPRLAVGDVSIASEGSAPCPPGSTTSPPKEGAFVPPGAEGFAVAPGAANTAAPASAASTSKRVIEVVLPRRVASPDPGMSQQNGSGYNRRKDPANTPFF